MRIQFVYLDTTLLNPYYPLKVGTTAYCYQVSNKPEDNVLKELQSIRNFFYENNFRYQNKPVSDKAHISLSVINDNLTDLFISELTKIFE